MKSEFNVKPSPQYALFLRQLKRRTSELRLIQVLLLIVCLALWQGSAHFHWANPMLTSSPVAIASSVYGYVRDNQLLMNTWVTLKETIFGFVLSMAIGTLIAVSLWWWRFLSQVLDPYLVVLNAIPKVALGPIFYVWLGDSLSVYGMALAISLIVTIVTLTTGFIEVDRSRMKLMDVFGASRWQALRIVILPASIPTFVSAMKVNIGLTLVGVIMGEFLSAKAGLGFLIIYGGQVFQMNLVMTSIVLLAVLSLAIYGVIAWIGMKLRRAYHFDS